jgi:hypothetical protein
MSGRDSYSPRPRGRVVSEARTPEEGTIETRDEAGSPSSGEDDYKGPDPETDRKGDRSDEDQGT